MRRTLNAERLRLPRNQLSDAELEWIGKLANGFDINQFDERINARQLRGRSYYRLRGEKGGNMRLKDD